MIGVLEQILCAVQQLAAAIVNALVFSVNGLILLLGLTLELLLGTLPEMPEPLAAPDEGVLQWINWIVPLIPIFAFVTAALVMFAIFMGAKVLLNWLRAL